MARLLSGLDPEKFDVTVISVVETSEDIIDLLPEHVTVHRLNISGVSDIYRISKLAPLLRGTDVLVCSLFHASVVGVPLGRLLGVSRLLVWQHNTTFKTRGRRVIYIQLYRLANDILADSNAVSRMLSEDLEVPPSKISQLPIAGVDTDRFAPTTPSKRSGDDAITVGTIARLVEQKGLFDLIQCAESLGDRYQFDVIGKGERRRELERSAPSNVTFLGTVEDHELPERLASYDIYFQPSKHEGLCMTVIEAMSCGLPVVASTVGGIPESVVPGTTGYLCDPGDIDCFSTHLKELGSDPELRRDMGMAGRDRVIEHYSQSVLVEKFESVIHQTSTR
jgi:glycosyltransferase involved in cell wall biosynthesis